MEIIYTKKYDIMYTLFEITSEICKQLQNHF